MQIGARIGAYEVIAKLGEGGMGEVYRARDTRLDRDVALKILPDAFASDPDRLLRFEREAKTLAALNHPRIAQIYGFEQSAPTTGQATVSALAMEFVEGEDFASRLARGRVPVDEALAIARQIADALEAAHAAGIIHRDLKPANVKMRPDGTVKVLDFGLAKTATATPDDSLNSPTITSPLTMHGTILGTAAYMSPEQALGRSVDHRADIWAFGCVVYELLAGERLFPGRVVTETIAEVLKKEVDFSRLPAETPASVRRMLRRCLQRDPGQRLHAIADARIELDDREPVAKPPARAVSSRWIAAVGLAIAGLAIGAAAMWLAGPRQQTDARVRAFTMEGAGFNFSGASSISRDGRWVAYAPDAEAAPFRVYLRSLASFEARQIGTSSDTGLNPFFSPDTQWVAFFANGGLYKSAVGGGDPQLLLATPGPDMRQGSWAPDGTIVFSSGNVPGSGNGLWKLAPGGTTAARLTQPASNETHIAPEVLPDGRTVLFTLLTPDSAAVAAVPLAGGPVQTILSGARSPRFAAGGHLFFQRSATNELVVTGFDSTTLAVSGEPAPLAAIARVNEIASYAVADDGTLVYSVTGEVADRARYSLVAVDRDGREHVLLAETGLYAQPRVSPDGNSILYRLIDQPYCDLWTLDLTRGTNTRVTIEGDNHEPVWHPNGRDITWASQLSTGFEVRSGPVDRSRPPQVLLKGVDARPSSWTRDGRLLAYVVAAAAGSFSDRPEGTTSDIHLFDAERGESRPFAATRFLEQHPAFSPDGQWIAWVSNETGRDEVYLQRVSGSGGRLQISTDGGHYPVWSPDGNELYFEETSRLMAVTVQLSASPQVSRARRIVEGPYAWERFGNYDIQPDGRGVVLVKRVGDVGNIATLRVVVNWPVLVRQAG